MSTIFSLSNLVMLPFWLLMIALPHWRWTQRIMGSPLVVAPPALLYTLLVLPRAPELLPTLASPSLDAVAELLSTPDGATLGWVHFLAFDLFVGRWMYLDSRERGVSAWLMAPILTLTLLMGPFGLVLYGLVRAATSSRLARQNVQAAT